MSKTFLLFCALIVVGMVYTLGIVIRGNENDKAARGSPSPYGTMTGPNTYHLNKTPDQTFDEKVAEYRKAPEVPDTKGTPQIQKPQAECKTDWTKCADNAEMANNYDDWI